jgi:hypothetical protein
VPTQSVTSPISKGDFLLWGKYRTIHVLIRAFKARCLSIWEPLLYLYQSAIITKSDINFKR